MRQTIILCDFCGNPTREFTSTLTLPTPGISLWPALTSPSICKAFMQRPKPVEYDTCQACVERMVVAVGGQVTVKDHELRVTLKLDRCEKG